VSKLPHKSTPSGRLVWFDNGSDDDEHWMLSTLAEELKGKPRLRGRIVSPMAAVSLFTTGSDADWQWVKRHCKEIGIDPKRLEMLSAIPRRGDNESYSDSD
jgi:hypothetical protein